ncbi:MAG TPA: hypothetical protein VJV78_39115 [Polyangiales bacterium]|nr:hypothetical protein [Polyangiales bacterium]
MPSSPRRNLRASTPHRKRSTAASAPAPEAKSSDPVLALALEWHARALRTGDPVDALLARTLDVAELLQRRCSAGAELAPAELLGELEHVLVKIAATREDDERIVPRAPQPRAYERATAVRALCARAKQGITLVQSDALGQYEVMAKVVASNLLVLVNELGLAPPKQLRLTQTRKQRAQAQRQAARLELELVDALLDARAHSERVAMLALRCCGVDRVDAENWVRGKSQESSHIRPK